jgi:hypothetical protein
MHQWNLAVDDFCLGSGTNLVSRKTALRLGRFLAVACLFVSAAGCASVKRVFSRSSDEETRPHFKVASLERAEPKKSGALASFHAIEDDSVSEDAFELDSGTAESRSRLLPRPVLRCRATQTRHPMHFAT